MESDNSQHSLELRQYAAWYLRDAHRFFWNIPIALVGVLLLLAFALSDLAKNPAKDEIQNLAELHALEPTPISDGENAAMDYVAAIEVRDKEAALAYYGRFSASNLAFGSGAGFDSSELRRYVEGHRSSIKRLYAGAGKRNANWSLDYSEGVSIRPTHLAPIREMARILAVYSRSCAREHNHREAARALGTIYAMSRHLESDPTLLCHLVSISLQSIADRTLAAILYFNTPKTNQDLAEYRRNFRKDRDSASKASRALKGEGLLTERLLIKLALGKCSLNEIDKLNAIDDHPGQNSPWIELYLHNLSPLWYGSEIEAIRIGNELLVEGALEGESVDRSALLPGLSKGTRIFARLMLPAHTYVVNSLQRVEAEGMALDLALALLSFHARSGAFPRELTELLPADLPELPLDPWNHQSFILQIRNEGWKECLPGDRTPKEFGSHQLRVYCLGKNGIDDNGSCFWIDQEGKNQDSGADDVFTRLPLRTEEEMK